MTLADVLLSLACGLRADALQADTQPWLNGLSVPLALSPAARQADAGPARRSAANANANLGSGEAAARAVSQAARSLDAELSLLDGGPLSAALGRAARQGRRLRLILDPRESETRAQGAVLAALSPSVEVRWRSAAGEPLRWMLADGALALAWGGLDGPRGPGDPGPHADFTRQRFERAWSRASLTLPESLRLSDQLHALPDPSVADPHYIRRRQGADDGEDHADPTRTQPAGP